MSLDKAAKKIRNLDIEIATETVVETSKIIGKYGQKCTNKKLIIPKQLAIKSESEEEQITLEK